jgi:pyruvate dehydrogenase E1 component beta subunit
MKTITYGESIKEAIEFEMKRDPMIFLAGEDVAKLGGAFGTTAGLAKEFGPDRVMDTPISETAIIGLAIGSSVLGMRPIVELMYVDFAGVAMDEIMNQAAKMRYMFGGKATLPMVVRAATGATVRGAAQHSQTIEAMFTHIPGMGGKGLSYPVQRPRWAISFCYTCFKGFFSDGMDG